ncbi:MAG TPA: CHAD domain-containing protein [Phenylobacterium sp.]|jgi:inorganic triphosphatase YgiF
MSDADREIELKFACGPEDLAAVLAAAPPGDEETHELISVYFDTPDLALKKAGASLRVREQQGRRVQTLKRGDGVEREEYEAPIEGLAPDPALGPLPSLTPKGAELRPVFNVRVSRRQRTLRYQDAEIELALDQGELSGGDQTRPICEVELELKSGPSTALFALARELSAAADLHLSFDSKAARGQALVAGEPQGPRKSGNVRIARDATAGDTFRAIAQNALAQIAANAAVLRAEPAAEAVHQLRVGVRRLRSALTTLEPLFGDDDPAAIKTDLKWLGHACDRARNLDAFAEEALKPAEGAGNPPPGAAALREAIDAARRRAWARARQTAASDRFRALMIEATAWLETGAWRDSEAARVPVEGFAGKALTRRLKALDRRRRAAEDGDDVSRHRLRIEAKKLRYSAEAFASLYSDKRVERYLRGLRRLQELLGALNDMATAEPLLAELKLTPEAAYAAGELVGLRAAAKPRLIARASKAADRLARAKPFWVT